MLEQRMQQPQRPGMLQGLGRGRPRIHDQFSWTGALMRAYVLDRVIDKIKSFDWSELFS
ncbi:hypothetical protein DPMN_065493 [Dreissena polymorpha]|uniref:Uncharacterized protein n=1 Tax=Dreissena polymorpha TaxID=45954 RepID=A0A9D4BU85_DREPO|nr:hypothetical protein DPMN_065493 [Dreissena polymorpha]